MKTNTFIVIGIILALIIGVALYKASVTYTVTPDTATSTEVQAPDQTVGTTTGKTSTTTTKITPVTPKAGMKASDFQLFIAAGHCKKVTHSKPLEGYRAIDFAKVTIESNQAAWKCSDGSYYTN